MRIFGFKIISVKEYEKLKHWQDVRTIRKLTSIMIQFAERGMNDKVSNLTTDLIEAVKDESGKTVQHVLNHYQDLANKV